MTPAEAAAILRQRLAGGLTDTKLYSLEWYLSAVAGDPEAVPDGSFTADELEAVVMWMRDSAGVSAS